MLTVADRQLDLHRIEQDDPGHVPFLVRLTSWWRQTAGPTTREKSPLIDRLHQAGLRPQQSGEVLLQGPDSKAAVEALLASPVHKQLLLHSHFRVAGLGAIRDGSHWIYCLLLADKIPVEPTGSI